MTIRTAHLRLLPPLPPDANPLNVVEATALPTGWTHIEVWRDGQLIGIGETLTAETTPGFLSCLADYWLNDRAAVVRHEGQKTGT